MGTLAYMSPEHLRRPRDVDARSDIYCIGATMFHLWTGTLPFGSESDFGLMSRIVDQSVPNPSAIRPDIPPGVAAIIMKAMARDPRLRFASCEELASALRAAVGDPIGPRLGATGDLPPLGEVAAFGGRLPLAVAAVTLTLAVAGLAGLLVSSSAPAELPQPTPIGGTAVPITPAPWVSSLNPPRVSAVPDWNVSLFDTGAAREGRSSGDLAGWTVDPLRAEPATVPEGIVTQATTPDIQTGAPPAAPSPSYPHFGEMQIPAGTPLRIQLQHPISSESAEIGNSIEGVLASPVIVGGEVVVPANAPVWGSVVAVVKGGQFARRAQLAVKFHLLSLGGTARFGITTTTASVVGPEAVGTEQVVAGATAGAIIGGVVAGTRGALLGGAAGVGKGLAGTRRSIVTLDNGAEVTVALTAATSVRGPSDD